MPTPPDRAHVDTEKRNPRTRGLHALTAAEVVELMQGEDRQVLLALKRAKARLTAFIEAAEPGFVAGGRLVYVGAGTSGRLGVLDASEAPPTFCVPPTRVVGVIAGGDGALRKSSEGAEDDPKGAWKELEALDLTSNDSVIAIAAGGTTPYALGALDFCKQKDRTAEKRPLTALLTCTSVERPASADHVIAIKTGPEVIAGSTRLKAGTATKMALNTISTTLMIRAGKVYENLMVDVRATNDKLRDRAARIVSQLTGLGRENAFALLDRCGGEVKTAAVVHKRGVTPEEARVLLEAVAGRLEKAIGG
ncbi:MAG TPA: N-acetylmuramic acid 6-phosphate etherase [Phycisphaerales bacterium]|nr:N-acetylmuramic acid 6-phosphate etherase [Phycisphaerales bacterium]